MTLSRFQVIKRKPREARTSVDGLVFDSVAEMRRYETLRSRLDVRNLQRQIRFPLMMRRRTGPEVHMRHHPSGRPAYYTLDFQYEELQNSTLGGSVWVTVYEEFKGMDDAASQLRRMIVSHYNEIEILVTGPAAKKAKAAKAASHD